MSVRWAQSLVVLLALISSVAAGCTVDQAPQGLKRTPAGPGATVRFDIFHKPLPDIPLPNDVATWPDPTSRTGLRLNASVFATTSIEHDARAKFDELEGWATYGWLSVGFDLQRDSGDRSIAALDLKNIARRHQGDDYDLADDAVYVINLKTGVPVPVDLGEGSFNYVLRDKNRYWPHDARRSEQYLLFETYDETGRDPSRAYAPELDTDFDGLLDLPNLDDPYACEGPPEDPSASGQSSRDRCLADHLMDWYERETDTLLINPLVPLEEMTPYAVVLTDRLIDSNGHAVKSPFDFVYHPMQEHRIGMLQKHLQNPAVAGYYGDIGGKGLDHVAFAWAFTTGPVVDDMRKLRDGLYGQGPFGYLAEQFPAQLDVSRAVGLHVQSDLDDGANDSDYLASDTCASKRDNLSIVRVADVKSAFAEVAGAIGLQGKEKEAFAASLDHIDYVIVGSFLAPFLMRGGPKNLDPNATFHVNFATGEGEVHTDRVWFFASIPKKTAAHRAPFPVHLNAHGTGLFSVESVIFAGTLAQQGLATIGVNAPGHGLDMPKEQQELVRVLFKGSCLGPFADAFLSGRARDLDNDGKLDSGGDLWTTYIFHTRDILRQTTLDYMQLVRILRTFDGQQRDRDYDGNGTVDLAGDFDGDGQVDIGGTQTHYSVSGGSFGGIIAGILGGIDPYVVSSVPNSGGGGLVHIAVRSFQPEVVESVTLRSLGPLVVSVVTPEEPDRARTSCAPGEISVQWVVTSVRSARTLEIACLPAQQGLGTAVVRNYANGEVRCARSRDGQFRMGIPSSAGDPVAIELYSTPDNVESYEGCKLKDASALVRTISSWESAVVAPFATDNGVVTCPNDSGCVTFEGRPIAVGAALTAPIEGLGYQRQSSSFRRFVGLAQSAVNSADPINYAPYYGLKAIHDPWGNVVPAHGVLTVHTMGDMMVPVNAGIAFARATGAIPFLRPEAAAQYPALADYATPAKLYEDLGYRTPNRILIDNHVIEGIARLRRHPAGASCQPNEKPASLSTCHSACPPLGPDGGCLPGQSCVEGVCRRTISPGRCEEALFDPDDIAEGAELFNQQRSSVPMRLARISANAVPGDLETTWAPRLRGVPYAANNGGAWDASQRVTGFLGAFILPEGVHTFHFSNPCDNFDTNGYLVNLTGRFFASEGRDIYYLSNPASHRCMATASCAVFAK